LHDIHACHQAPKHFRVVREQQRAGLYAVDGERREQQRVAGIDGMPSASSGIMAVPVTALLAVSGPATPAMAP